MAPQTRNILDPFFNDANKASLSFLNARKALDEDGVNIVNHIYCSLRLTASLQVENSECDFSVWSSHCNDTYIHIHKTC